MMLGDPLCQPVFAPLLVRGLGVGVLSLVNLGVTLIAERLKVGPLEGQAAAVLFGAARLDRHDVMDAACGGHVPLGLASLA